MTFPEFTYSNIVTNPYVYCTDVWVRFQAHHAQAVHLSRNDHVTGIHRLGVSLSDGVLSIQYLDAKGWCRKMVNYNFDAIMDYSCEGVQIPAEEEKAK